jgi:hypothetical protein
VCLECVQQRLASVLADPDLEELQLDSTVLKALPIAATGRRLPEEKKALRRDELSTAVVAG